jgi:RNA polymerase sigma-70 factor (ECF subfamily)
VDEATLAAARRGNRQATERLLRELQDHWYRLCLGLLRDGDLARDATQETALRFLKQLPGFRGDSQLRTWSLGIAINVVREMRRSAGRAMELSDEVLAEAPADSAQPPAGDAEVAERRDALHALLAALPERQREAVVLRYFEDMSTEQTAAAMDCAAGTVKATLHQALRSLREKLREFV